MAGNRHDREEQEVHVPDINRPETMHEQRDVNAWAVGKVGIGLVFLCILSVGLLWGVFRYYASRQGGRLQDGTLRIDARGLPPQPRLQPSPILDMEEMRAAEEQLLNSYGWVDEEKGLVRIPVARAMELLAAQPPASRPQAEMPAPSDVSVPTESGLGPKVQRPGGPLAEELNTARNTGAPASGAAPKGAEKE